jgi:hypothetical protein
MRRQIIEQPPQHQAISDVRMKNGKFDKSGRIFLIRHDPCSQAFYLSVTEAVAVKVRTIDLEWMLIQQPFSPE